MGKKKKTEPIRTNPFEELTRVENGFETGYGESREEYPEILAFEAQDIRKRFHQTPQDYARADEIEAWLQIKAGDDATDAIRTAFSRYCELFQEAWREDPIRDDPDCCYDCAQSFDDLADLNGYIEDLLDDRVRTIIQAGVVRKERKDFETRRAEVLAQMRKVAKRMRGVIIKDYMAWFRSTLSNIQKRGDGYAFARNPIPYLTGNNGKILILFA